MISPQYNKAVGALLTAVINNNPIGVTTNMAQKGIAVNNLDVNQFVMRLNEVNFKDKQEASAYIATVLNVEIVQGNPYAIDLVQLRQRFEGQSIGQIAYVILNAAMGTPVNGTMPELMKLENEQKTNDVLNQLTPKQFQVVSGAVMVLSLIGLLFVVVLLSKGTSKILSSIFT
jgi:hypothetical protein